jgi:ABC-type branched-subunit amino acid transport system ATPase component/sugar phosphate permease
VTDVVDGDGATGELPALSPESTPRPDFQVSRRLVGMSRWPLGLLTAVYAVSVADQYLFGAVFPFLKHDFQLSDTELGFLGGAFFITATMATLPVGRLVDRVRRTRIIAWGAVLWGVAMLWSGLATGYLMLLAARAALGAAQPAGGPTSQSLLADYYPVSQRSKVMGIYQSGQLLAFILIPIGATMATAWGWRSAFYFFAIPGFVVALFAWHLAEPVRGAQDRRLRSPAVLGATRSEGGDIADMTAYRRILSCRTYTVALISTAVGGFFFGGISVWTVTFLTTYHNLTVPQASTAVSLFALGGLVGALSSGPVADRLVQAGRASARVGVAGLSRVACGLFMYIAFAVPNTALMLLSFTIGSALIIAPLPPINAVLADVLHPNLRGRGVALYYVVKTLCEGTSPIIFGFLADRIGLRASFLILIPCVVVAGLILLAFATTSYPRDARRMAEELASEGELSNLEPEADGAGRVPAVAPLAAMGAAGATNQPAASASLLEIVNADLSYGPVQVLFGLDLQLTRTGCHVLLGRNGVGKTTLLSAIAGILEPQAGEIRFHGEDVTGIPAEQRARLGITLVVGGRATFPGLSVKDNLWIGAYPFTSSRRLVVRRQAAVLEVFPALADRLNQAAGTLSGGEQQMMALGRALMAGPELLLIDEFSIGLAPVVVEELILAVERIVALGTTLLVVEQSVDVALRIADEVLYMDRTGIRHLGPPDAHLPSTIADLMLGAAT